MSLWNTLNSCQCLIENESKSSYYLLQSHFDVITCIRHTAVAPCETSGGEIVGTDGVVVTKADLWV